jgi:DNA-binding LacI/PurR family transcriptional regulator
MRLLLTMIATGAPAESNVVVPVHLIARAST